MQRSTRRHITAGSLGILLAAMSPAVAEAQLYAIGQTVKDKKAPENLYEIDTGTGAATLIGSTGHSLRGLGSHPLTGVLYSVGSRSGPDAGLWTIDKTTGAATYVGGSFEGSSLAFGPDGTLYGRTSYEVATYDIYTLNLTTGAATLLANLAQNYYGGIVVTPDGSALLSIGEDGFDSLDLTTLVETHLTDWATWAPSGEPGRFAYMYGILFGVGSPRLVSDLYILDLGTEMDTSVGSTGLHVTGMTFSAVMVPTMPPAGLVLLLLSLVAFAGHRLAARSAGAGAG